MNYIHRNPSRVLTFLFSLIPGAGHMYLGYMQRGVEIMAAFFCSIFVISTILMFTEIGIPLAVIIFFYSFFDAQHLMRAIQRGEELDDMGLIKFKKYRLNEYHIGLGTIVLGAIFLYNRLGSFIRRYLPDQLYFIIERSIIPVLIMALGLYLILNSRNTFSGNTEQH